MGVKDADRIKSLSVAFECALAIGNTLDLNEMLGEVIRTLVNKTKAHYGIIWFKGKREKTFKPLVSFKIKIKDKKVSRKINVLQRMLGKAKKSKKFLLLRRSDKDFGLYCPELTGREESVLIIPVNKVAIIHLVYDKEKKVDRFLADLLAGFSESLKCAINNCLYKDKLMSDYRRSEEIESKLMRSREEYLSLFDRIDSYINIVNKSLQVVYLNKPFKRWLKKLGLESENLIGKNLYDAFPFLSERIREEYNQVFREGELLITEESHDIAGKTIAIETRKIPVMYKDNAIGVVTIITDITERMKKEKELKDLYRESEESRRALLSILEDVTETERALRKSQERFQDIVKNTGDWIWEVDGNGRYTYSNEIVERVLGYKPEEVLGKFFYDFFHPDVRDKLKKKAFEAFEKKEPFIGFVNQNVHKDGHTVILETSGVAIMKEDGSLIGYRGVDRDITQRKQMEDELKDSLQQSEFLLDLMSHDLNNINQAILSSLELILTGEYPPTNFPRFLNLAVAEVHRSKSLVSNVKKLIFLREHRWRKKKTRTLPVLKRAIIQVERDFPRKDIIISIKARKEERLTAADELLHDLFYNILHNAARFDRHKEVVVDIGVTSDKGYWRFEFKDRGPGIPDERKQEVFFRTKVRGDGHRGSGLGLTLVKGIIDRYKGKVWVEDRIKGKPEKGSNFIILLPKYGAD